MNKEVVAQLLVDVWSEVVQPTLVTAEEEADLLIEAAEVWAANPEDVEAQEAAQEQFAATLRAWQVAEAMQVGPAASSMTAVGGQDLRDEVYSWPTVNACRVDQEMVERGFEATDFFEVELVNVTGFDALDTLLYSPDDTNMCPALVGINTDGSFDALGVTGVRTNRADYAVVLARRILSQIDTIAEAWDPNAGDFATDLANAGGPGSSYATQDEALNAVFDALFYLETATKDRKLGEPLGLRDCGQDSCLHMVETPLSGLSAVWISANLEGFRTLYTGGEGSGLDDLLVAMGHEDVHVAMSQALDEAEAAALALDQPIDLAAQGDATQALATHEAITALTTILKGDVATVLFLQIPDEAAGDND